MDPQAFRDMASVERKHWWFVGRRLILEDAIQRMITYRPLRILEVGAGTGGNIELLSKYGSVTAVELDDDARRIAVERHSGRANILKGSLPGDMPALTNPFDLVCLFDVLEHIEDDRPSLDSLLPYIAKDGFLLLTVPANPWLWSRHDEVLHHKRRYTKRELRTKLEGSGYEVHRISYFNTALFPLAVLDRMRQAIVGSELAMRMPSELVNSALLHIFASERFLLRRVALPFGLSLLVLATPRVLAGYNQ